MDPKSSLARVTGFLFLICRPRAASSEGRRSSWELCAPSQDARRHFGLAFLQPQMRDFGPTSTRQPQLLRIQFEVPKANRSNNPSSNYDLGPDLQRAHQQLPKILPLNRSPKSHPRQRSRVSPHTAQEDNTGALGAGRQRCRSHCRHSGARSSSREKPRHTSPRLLYTPARAAKQTSPAHARVPVKVGVIFAHERGEADIGCFSHQATLSPPGSAQGCGSRPPEAGPREGSAPEPCPAAGSKLSRAARYNRLTRTTAVTRLRLIGLREQQVIADQHRFNPKRSNAEPRASCLGQGRGWPGPTRAPPRTPARALPGTSGRRDAMATRCSTGGPAATQRDETRRNEASPGKAKSVGRDGALAGSSPLLLCRGQGQQPCGHGSASPGNLLWVPAQLVGAEI